MTSGDVLEVMDAWNELTELVERIGILCDDETCKWCTQAKELADRLHGYPAGTYGYNNFKCRCAYCRSRHARAQRNRREGMLRST